jgi:hypothetical protein
MKSSITWPAIAFLIVIGLINVAFVVLAVTGWKRHRHIAYVLLFAWSLVALCNGFQYLFIPHIHEWVMSMFPRSEAHVIISLINMGSHVVSSVLLLTAITLLVFGPKHRNTPAADGN